MYKVKVTSGYGNRDRILRQTPGGKGTEVDITEFPQNIHEYHRMIATAQANAMKLKELQKAAKEEST